MLLTVLTLLQLLLYIPLLALAGQGLLFVLAGDRRETNLFYQLLRLLSKPFTWAVRKLSPALAKLSSGDPIPMSHARGRVPSSSWGSSSTSVSVRGPPPAHAFCQTRKPKSRQSHPSPPKLASRETNKPPAPRR